MSFVARIIKFMLFFTLMCAGGYFVVYNGSPIEVSFGHLGGIHIPAAAAYIISFFAGGVLVAGYFGYEYTRQSITILQLRRRLRRHEADQTKVAIAATKDGGPNSTGQRNQSAAGV